ncbi:hypothetical protein [Algoriphagus litoralis]|uniref:hypothetical protein n=1 Tax=Algoriphagus litoralis TaxID=2202829 RepID=UPI0013002345|nr:hypothetical protein [Algoriphagus litoralis]
MKSIFPFLILFSLAMKAISQENVTIPAMKSIELSYAEYGQYDVKLINNSGKPIAVAVIDPTTQRPVKSFGLGPVAFAVLSADKGQQIKLTNNSLKEIKMMLEFVEKKPDTYNPENAPVVNFTFHNSSLRSIPLIIPNVMNPNLSPLSNSGVSLKWGQEIYYRKGNEKILILTIDESIQNGDKIDVSKLIKDLK